MKKKASRRRVEVNVEELDRIIDGAMREPLNEADGQTLKTALHTMAEKLVRARNTEKKSAVLGDQNSSATSEEPSMAPCAWARAHYDVQRARGKGHQAAIRSIAFKWIRILVRCWKDHTLYDESRYIQGLSRRSGTPSLAVTIMWKNVAGFSKPTGFSA
jgi:hypothetical protein